MKKNNILKKIPKEPKNNLFSPFKSDIILVIVESPSKCQTIKEILGENYKVVATKGHLYEIDGLKALNKKTYEPKYNILKHQSQTIENLKQDISIASKIILATDGDREGEIIAYHICKIFKLPIETTPRIIFNEITKNAILQAINNPTIININIVKAQQARSVLDILVGYKISPLLWKYIPKINNNTFSAGRCQTPALKLIYENYLEKEKLKENQISPIYKIYSYFFPQKLPFICVYANKIENVSFNKPEDVKLFLEKSKTFNHIFLECSDVKIKTEKTPEPLNTSDIIQICSNKLHISPKQTMQICQKLYQSGYITYMRTTNRKLSVQSIQQITEYIIKKYGKNFCNENNFKEQKKIETIETQEAHEAIRPTYIEIENLPKDKDIDTIQKSVYKIIRNRTLESCMCDSISEIRQIFISAPDNYRYFYEIINPIKSGWKEINEPISTKNIQKTQYSFFTNNRLILSPKIGDICPYSRIETHTTIKSNHSFYTEANLVKTLENLNIGRPSTYSNLIDIIQQREYVKKKDIDGIILNYTEFCLENPKSEIIETIIQKEFGKEKNKLVIQNSGIQAIEFLIKYFNDFFSYDYTSKMEENLDFIELGTETWNKICFETDNILTELITPINLISKKKYVLDENHEVIFSKNGPVIKCGEEPPIFKTIKKDIIIDIIKLDNGEYTLNDLLELQNDYLGLYEDEPLYLRNGAFGYYVEWGNNKKSIKNLINNKNIDEITITDIDNFLNNKNIDIINNKNILRLISPELSVRKGKYGPYIFYKTQEMKEPKFIRLTKQFRKGYMTCSPNDLLELCTAL